MGTTPIATIQQGKVYRIYADQLDTPRVITDSNGKTLWCWDSSPFGETAANEDADGDGVTLNYNPRFLGQLYDAETGLHYNYHRDYNPETGRYVQSDPIGLAGGLNTFGYAGQNPYGYVDPDGKRKRGLFDSIEKAALYGFKSIAKIPNSTRFEYGGAVYGFSDGSFSISSLTTNNQPTGVIIDDLVLPPPNGGTTVAQFHNHPREIGLPAADLDLIAYEFSPNDIESAESLRIQSFMGVFDGAIKHYDFNSQLQRWIEESAISKRIALGGGNSKPLIVGLNRTINMLAKTNFPELDRTLFQRIRIGQ